MTAPVFPTGILCAEIAALHRQLADSYDKLGQRLAQHDARIAGTVPADEEKAKAAEKSATVADTLNAEAAATAKREEAKAKKEKKAKADPPPAEAPKLTPEQIASRLKESIVALATKDRPKCAAIVASYGAKKFSEIPVEKHAEALAEITAALDGKPKAEEDLLG